MEKAIKSMVIKLECTRCGSKVVDIIDILHIPVKHHLGVLRSLDYTYISHYIKTECPVCHYENGFFEEYLKENKVVMELLETFDFIDLGEQ